VPVDFSRSSQRALDKALEYFGAQRPQIVLVHVIEPLSYAVPRFVPEPTMLLEEQRKIAARELTRLQSRLKRRGIRVRAEIHFGVVAQMIVDAARRAKADLIVIATHGRTGLAHLVMGSVAERVVRAASCPVLTVRTVPAPAPARPRRGKKRA
jgi:nucleotide-binding universal stress UspA family protein